MDLTLGGQAVVATNAEGGLFGEPAEATAGAVFSADPARRYRYRLWRKLGEGDRRCVFAMLNPSTADAFVLDNTVRRCMSFARREECDQLWVVNLFAWRSTDPKALPKVEDPIGPLNDEHILDTCRGAALVIGGWGADPFAARSRRAAHVAMLLASNGIDLHRLGEPTLSGMPGHPLFLDRWTPVVLETSGKTSA